MMDSRLFVTAEGNHEVLNEGADKFAAMFPYPQRSSGVPAPLDTRRLQLRLRQRAHRCDQQRAR